jgi:hypothetical protein
VSVEQPGGIVVNISATRAVTPQAVVDAFRAYERCVAFEGAGYWNGVVRRTTTHDASVRKARARRLRVKYRRQMRGYP